MTINRQFDDNNTIPHAAVLLIFYPVSLLSSVCSIAIEGVTNSSTSFLKNIRKEADKTLNLHA